MASIDTSGLDAFIAAIENVEITIEQSVEPFVEKCKDLALEEATNNFSNAIYAGANDVSVNGTSTKSEAIIKATGSAVNFIEFGTGIFFPDIHPDMGINGFARGTYGKQRGSNPNGWVYKGPIGNSPVSWNIGQNGRAVRTKGNPANMCMYKARETVLEKGQEIWNEVCK